MMTMKRLAKLLLIIWFFYHLGVIVIMSNGSSYMGRTLSPLFAPYANSILLNTTWNFFSPDPAHVMYMRYRLYFENDQNEEIKEPETRYFPEEKNELAKTGVSRRYLYAMRYFVLAPQKLESIMAPWLCKKNPEASRILIEYQMEQIPTLHQAHRESGESVESMMESKRFSNLEFYCEKSKANEILSESGR